MKTLVIPEDATHDQYILKPVVERIFDELGRTCRVIVLPEPRIQGVDQALNADCIAAILERYPIIDLFLLIVDRDCDAEREAGRLAARLAQASAADKMMLACLAIEEVETWALALHHKSKDGKWNDVRKECHPKEAYFEPLAERMGWTTALGRGRKAAMQAIAGRGWKTLKGRCPEIQRLQNQIRDWLDSQRA